MLSTADVQHGVKKFTPVSVFALSMVLLGALVNKFPPEEESVVLGRDFTCSQFPKRNLSAAVTPYNNYSVDPVLPSFGLAAISLVLPLMPLVVPVLALGVRGQPSPEHHFVQSGDALGDPGNFEDLSLSARTELNKIALRFALQLFVGQASCYGSTELARHFILKPDQTFFEKCKLQRTTCRNLENLGVLVYRVGGNDTTSKLPTLCQNPDIPDTDLQESLHSLPNTTSAIVGSSLVMFVIGMWMRRKILDYVGRVEKNEEEKSVGVGISLIGRGAQRNTLKEAEEEAAAIEEIQAKRNSRIETLLQETNPYFKIGMLVLSLCLLTVLLVDRYRQKRNDAYEIAGSVACGVVVQCLVNVFYALKKDSFA